MQRRVFSTSVSFLFIALAAILFSTTHCATGYAQLRIAPEAAPDAVSELLEKGRQIEAAGRWSEALSHYERSLHEHPGHQQIRERLDLARIRYSLQRRYADPSFERTTNSINSQTAMDLYNELLLKINSHYLEAPKWQQLVTRGTMSLDVALGNQTFRDRNLQGAGAEQISRFRDEMYQVIGRRVIRSRHDARQAVAEVVELARHRLNMRGPAVVFEYAAGATGGLDTYSAFLTPDQLKDVYSQIEGNFVGLGVELKADDGALLIVHVIPGSPAQRAGIRENDRITAVDGRPTAGLSTDQAAAMLQGELGTVVQITAASPGQLPRLLNIRRAHVEVPSVENAHIIDRNFGIGYLKLPSFQKTTSHDLDTALWKLDREGMRSLVIDLRGNPGGLLTAAVEVADKFLEGGSIVSTRGRSPQEDFNYTAHQSGTWRVPLVVLIDYDSASASEIFAAAIRDHRRGTIVGVRSYGKGSVQGIFPLGFASAGVRLTTAKFYSPSLKAISNVGVEPDIVVREAAKPVGNGATGVGDQQDLILSAGVDAARRKLASR
jgi:carboxyl-terminal processing protease